VAKEAPLPAGAVRPHDENIVHVMEPEEGLMGTRVKAISSKSSMKKPGMTDVRSSCPT
jgi:hypothetical protein